MISAVLDTHIVLWTRIAPGRLTTRERQVLDNARSCYVSAISLLEIAILMALDRVVRDERRLVARDGLALLSVLPDHRRALVVVLPPCHRDPFGRRLIAQARTELCLC